MSTVFEKKVARFLDNTANIYDICTPLFRSSAVNAFSYIKIKNNTEMTYLCSDGSWLNYFFKNNYHNQFTPSFLPELFHYQYVLCQTLQYKKIIIEAEQNFNFSHVFSINFNHSNESEFFVFSSEKQNDYMENWYLNNLNQLQQFCIYFKSLLDNLNKHVSPVVINDGALDSPYKLEQIEYANHIIQGINAPKKIWLTNEHEEHYITRHELQCLKLLFEGKNAHEIAEVVHRSVRTIETHIYNIKRKLNCSKRSELIQKIIDNKLYLF